MAKVTPEKIIITDITVTDANIKVTRGKDLLEQNKSFKLICNASTSLSDEDQTFCKIDFTANFSPSEELEDSTDFSASFSIEFIFKIENLEEFKVKNDQAEHGFLLDTVLGVTLMGIVYSTARGMILTRTAGTVLDRIVLPVVNPAQLLDTV